MPWCQRVPWGDFDVIGIRTVVAENESSIANLLIEFSPLNTVSVCFQVVNLGPIVDLSLLIDILTFSRLIFVGKQQCQLLGQMTWHPWLFHLQASLLPFNPIGIPQASKEISV